MVLLPGLMVFSCFRPLSRQKHTQHNNRFVMMSLRVRAEGFVSAPFPGKRGKRAGFVHRFAACLSSLFFFFLCFLLFLSFFLSFVLSSVGQRSYVECGAQKGIQIRHVLESIF